MDLTESSEMRVIAVYRRSLALFDDFFDGPMRRCQVRHGKNPGQGELHAADLCISIAGKQNRLPEFLGEVI